MKTQYCNGIKTSGHWKGYQCAAVGKYEFGGKWYCANHLVTAMNLSQRLHNPMEYPYAEYQHDTQKKE